MNSFFARALGCRLNQYEIDVLSSELKNIGLTRVDANADICIINTCTVTHVADRKSRKEIRKIIRNNPNAFVVVTGCFAQTEREELNKISGIDLIVDNSKKEKIVDLLYNRGVISNIPGKILNYNVDRSRPAIKIQDGCNHLCTYCKVRIARGRSRSNNINEIVETVKHLSNKGFEEVVFTGVNIGDYNWKGVRLAGLLKKVLSETSNIRIRLSSIEPTDITEELFEVMSDTRICKYFHIPLQSGSNRILQLMKRPYTREKYIDKINRLKSISADVVIGADVIVGFPGETDSDFNDTFNLLKENNIFYLHVFKYSKRENTEAALLPDEVDEITKNKRSETLIKYRDESKYQFFKTLINKEFDAIIEGKPARDNLVTSLTDNYITVLVDRNSAQPYLKKNKRIIVTEFKDNVLIGKLKTNV